MESLQLHSIDNKIFEIRGLKVMLDSDLALLYKVETKRINEAVKNNRYKFPIEFYFELDKDEVETLRSKSSTFKESLRGSKYLPKVFTEQGVYMLATILKSKFATDVTLTIIKTFAKLREFAIGYQDIITRLNEIEKVMKIDQQHLNYNASRIDDAFELLNQILRDTQNTDKCLIGFRPLYVCANSSI